MSVDVIVDEQSASSTAWQLQRTGNFIGALDLAQESLRRWPGSQALQYLEILAMGSCGSTQAALDTLRATGLGLNVDEDSQALEARLLKDLAFGRFSTGMAPLTEAAAAYERVAERTGGTYSRQNAALLWMLAGESARASVLAAAVIRQLDATPVPADDEGTYFYWATRAEAALVLDDHAGFERARLAADPTCRRNAWARSRTLKQMGRLTALRPDHAPLIERWYRPPVGLVLNDGASELCGEAEHLDAHDLPALAYCVGDSSGTAWQELAAFGVQLHAIYPGMPGRPMHDASGHADTHTWSNLLLDDGDDRRACTLTALGLSLGQADQLRAPWVVLAKAADRWCIYRHASGQAVRAALDPADVAPTRSTYAFLFADAVSYSSLNAEETRRYWGRLLPQTAAAVLNRHAADVVLRKTWGDLVHAVFTSASAAAGAALEIQEATANLVEDLGRGRRLEFRLALHFGAADEGVDPVEATPTIFGPQLSFAARIEPVTPPGGVFVTEAFAARLSLEGNREVQCAYVGTISLAKSYGRVRLLRMSCGET